MSMPTIKIENIDLNQAKNNVIASIALEEAALSHILNAEGEKLQAVIGMSGVTSDQLKDINTTVADVLSGVSDIETALRGKLSAVLPAPSPAPAVISELITSSNDARFLPPVGITTIVSFRQNLFSVGSAVSHTADNPNIVINKAGRYQVYYQIYVDNSTHTAGVPVSLGMGLGGSSAGTIISDTSTATGTLMSKHTEVSLKAGEILSMFLNVTGEDVVAVSPTVYIREVV
jgi:hypothetical protein